MLAIHLQICAPQPALHRNELAGEWPLHPLRVFQCLVAQFCEIHADPAIDVELYNRALSWLEQLPPPHLHAGSPADDALRIVYFWPHIDASEFAVHRPAIEDLAARVSKLPAPAMPVELGVIDSAPAATHEPSDAGQELLRVATPGQVGKLIADCTAALAANRAWIPTGGLFASYQRIQELQAPADTRIGESIILFRKTSGPEIDLSRAHLLLSTARRILLQREAGVQFSPELSGHDADGNPTETPHIAMMPLAYLDAHFADGRLMGFAVVLPTATSSRARDEIRDALRRLRQIHVGRNTGTWQVERFVPNDAHPWSLQIWPYLGPATHWASVTPMMLDRFPKATPADRAIAAERVEHWLAAQVEPVDDRDRRRQTRHFAMMAALDREATAIVADACERAGFPPPASVAVSAESPVRGVPHRNEFRLAEFRDEHLPRRFDTHVQIAFDQPIQGPLLLGAGRYFGLGLFRMMRPSPVHRHG